MYVDSGHLSGEMSVAGRAKNSNYFNILWKNRGRQSSIPIIENVWEDNYE